MEQQGVKVNLHQLLRAMIEKGASDMHITTGSPPLLRIDGAIIPLKLQPLSPVDTRQLCYSVLTEEQKIQFEKNKLFQSEPGAAYGSQAPQSQQKTKKGSSNEYSIYSDFQGVHQSSTSTAMNKSVLSRTCGFQVNS